MFKKKSHTPDKKHPRKETGLERLQSEIEDFGQEIEKDLKVVAKKIKKKIALFYKINFFILLTLSVVLAYFIILVSTTPKSFPFVTQEIRSQLQKNFGESTQLEDARISFTRYGTLKVSITNLKFLHAAPLKKEKQEFLIPRIETEFSLLNLVRSSFVPRKIKIINPEIAIDYGENSEQSGAAKNSEEVINPTAVVVGFLEQMKEEKFLTKNFEIENARFVIKGQKSVTQILIKKSQIRTYAKNDILYISSANKLSFEDKKSDVDLNSACQLAKNNSLKCDLFLINFVPNSIAGLHPSLKALEQINTTVNTSASFAIENNKLHNVIFKAEAKKGNFTFPEFFSEQMDFYDFSAKGEYDNNLGILNLSEIKTDFQVDGYDLENPSVATSKAHFDMSLLISDLKNLQNNRFDFYIKLQNAPCNELEKLWPVYLHEEGIRDWVIAHIRNGEVKDAYAKFSLIKNGAETVLEKIDSEVIFSDFDLKYSDDFPEITKVDGVAKFTKDNMNIAISSGSVLGSKISEAQVVIDNFHAPVTMLKISGKSVGSASDSLKHADNSSKFSAQVEKYLNGNSQNNFDIRIPLESKLALKDAYIAVNSAINNLNNDYAKGAVTAVVKKDFGSEEFSASVDLKAAELNIKALNIEKKSDVEGGLNLTIAFPTAKKITLKNIVLRKQEKITAKKVTKIVDSKISGNVNLEVAPFLVTDVNLRNDKFGKNSYSFSYVTDKKSSSERISLNGQLLDLAPFIQNKFSGIIGGGEKFRNSTVQIALNNLLLSDGKSVKDFYVGLNCDDQFCYSGAARGNYGKKQQLIALQFTKKDAESFSRIDGRITDVGYLAEALGISNVVSAGDAKLKMQNKIVNEKQVLEGEITINESITFYESAAVKRLAKDDLFSQVRDKIFSNNKTTFDSLKLEFALQDGVFNIKSLIANNYKIGITAKGTIDLKNDTYEIKGMIVPGFIINNLFGIGNIPILGNVISGLLTGGQGGGLFGIRYEYSKKKGDKEATFETNKVSAFVPTTIKNLFDLI